LEINKTTARNWKPNFTHAHINFSLQINFSLIMTPSLQGLPYWENGPLRKNTNYSKPDNFGPEETLFPICPNLSAGHSDLH
jgi:hypothetical protein